MATTPGNYALTKSEEIPNREGGEKSTSQEMTDAGEDAEKGEPSYTVGGNTSWCSHSGK